MGNVLAVKDDRAPGGDFHPGNHLGNSGFAAAVGPGDDHELILLDGKADVLQNVHVARIVVHVKTDVIQFQHCVLSLLIEKNQKYRM